MIVGGGTAGWLTAAIIAAHHRNRSPEDLSISLVEAADVPTVGVGEGTWPTLRNTMRVIGLDERELFRRCFAGFKQGGKFVNWVTDDDSYYHPFTVPLGYGALDLAPYVDDVRAFAFEANYQSDVCEAGLAPRRVGEASYQGVCNYAYHLDAGAFADFLKEHCKTALGVDHHIGTVQDVIRKDDGGIDRLRLVRGGEGFELKADLYVDCTGFQSLLLGQALGVGFTPLDDVLFNDTALAVRVPYADDRVPIAPYTIATGQNAGWIWDIGLTNRRGVGHVYSSQFLSEGEAAENLSRYLGGDLDTLDVKKITFRAGRRNAAWQRNCVAIGLSCGFVEPLEATAIMLIEVAARYVAENVFPDASSQAISAKRFNQHMDYRWRRIGDFLKLHYVLTQRDEPYWRAHTDPATIPESLSEDLEIWRHRGPVKSDFDGVAELFPAASYQYVLYGMGYEPRFDRQGYLHNERDGAQRLREKNQSVRRQLLSDLPPHRAYIEHWLASSAG